MSENVNGWSVIARHLLMRGKNQSDLARMLHISPAAVTQIKNGQFHLNSKQLQAITAYLEFSSAAYDEFYSEIFNARIHCCRGERINALDQFHCVVKTQHREPGRKIPVGTAALLRKYNPALEPLNDFLCRSSMERVSYPFRNGSVMIRTDKEDEIFGIPAKFRLIVNGESYPVPGEKVLTAWADGKFSAGIYQIEGSRVQIAPLEDAGKCGLNFALCHRSDLIRWVHPLTRAEEENAAVPAFTKEP